MKIVLDFLFVWGLFMLTVISPGPDFLIVTKTSLNKGFRYGLLTAWGIGCGLLIHSAYCLLGVAVLIRETPFLFDLLKVVGGVYLCWLGIKSFLSSGIISQNEDDQEGRSIHGSFLTGFLINITNIKVTLCFLAFFTSIVPEYFSIGLRILFVICSILGAVAFFCFLALTISRPIIRNKILIAGCWIDRIIGVAFFLLGGEILGSLFQ